MENLDVMVLRSLRDWRQAGKRALLATVVRTWGSSPRPVGSIMALAEDGAVVGSVSGGCIEDDLIYRFTRAYAGEPSSAPSAEVQSATEGDDKAIPSGPPRFVKYGITADEAHRFGLPCGGTLELLLEFDPAADRLSELIASLEAGRLMQRSIALSDGTVSLAPAHAPQALRVSDAELVNTFGPEYRMLLIGAGQLTEYVATMALFCGFAVTVCDPRPEYRSGWSVAGVSLTSDMPDDVVTAFRPDRRSCVVALTHDPKLDDLALLEALETDAFYVGAIGSRRNNDARRERMIEHFEQTEASLARLRGPVGIYIGSKTPSEIAVSVMAEILAVKNGVALPRDMDVAQAKNARAGLTWSCLRRAPRANQTRCRTTFGRLLQLHHAGTPGNGPRRNDALRRSRYWACKKEGIDPRKPARLPLLFALDKKFAVPGGFSYLPDCRDIDRQSSSDVYCGTSFGEDGGGSGSADDFGGSDASSDGGCGGDSGCGGD